MTRQQQFDYLFKIVMIGDSGVGKTNLLSRFVDNTFNMDSKPTIGVQFATKTINIEGKSIKNQIWDTAGQERFRAITNAYYRGAVGAIIAFDLTKSKSFENVQKWLTELRDNAEPNITIMLLGNKSDLLESREVKQESVQDYVNKHKLLYLETSASSGNNVNLSFSQLIKQVYKKIKSNVPEEKESISRLPTRDNKDKTMSKGSDKRVEEDSAKGDKVKLQTKQKSAKKKACCQ